MNRKWLVPSLLLILTLPYYLYLQKAHPLIGEEFMLFVQAERVLNGEVPYRDFFQFITPGSIYLSALLFKIFGLKLIVMKILISIMGSAIVILSYLISIKIIQKPFIAMMPPVLVIFYSIPQVPLFYHHWNAEVLILLGILFGLKYISENKSHFIFLCGLTSGLTFLFLQHKGALVFIAILLFLIVNYSINRGKILTPLILVTAGFIITLAPFLLFLHLTGTTSKFFYDCFVWTKDFYAPFNSLPEYLYFEKKLFFHYFQKEGLLPAIIKTRNYLFVGYLPIFIIFIGIIDLFKNLKKQVLFLYILSLFLFISTLVRPGFTNIMYVSQPFFILLGHYLSEASERYNKVKESYVNITVYPVIALFIFNSLYGCIATLRDTTLYKHQIKTRRGIINFKSIDDMQLYSDIFSLIESSPEEKRFFFYNWSTFFYFLSGIKNYTSYDSFLPAYNTESQMNELIQQLEENKIEYIIYDSMDLWIKKKEKGSLYPEGSIKIDLNNKLNEYIHQHYEKIDEFGDFKVLRLKKIKNAL